MATWYFDRSGGDNANSGLTFALRKKDMSGVTLAAGDTVRVAKTPDATLVGNATFTDLSKTITLATAKNLLIQDCETVWTGSANVTATAGTVTFKEGTAAANLLVAAAFTTGIIAYKAMTSTDFSGYQQVTFWIRAGIAIASGVLSLRLCSDVAGVTAVDTLVINVALKAGFWMPVTIDKGSALGSAIQSIALNAVSDPGNVTIMLDNINACLASSADDSLSLTSAIGKNTSGESFLPLQSISGTTLILGGGVSLNGNSASLFGYTGTTETVSLYKIEPVVGIDNGSTTASSWGSLTNAGTQASPIIISGGWNTTDMTTQTGESWFTMRSNSDIGIRFASTCAYITVSKINFIHHQYGFYQPGATNITLDSVHSNGHSNYGVLANTLAARNTYTNTNTQLNAVGGLGLSYSSLATGVKVYGNVSRGLVFGASSNVVKSSTIRNNNYGVDFLNHGQNRVYDTFVGNNLAASGSILIDSGRNFLFNVTLDDANQVSSTTTHLEPHIYHHNFNGVANTYRITKQGGRISSVTDANREKASGSCWMIEVTSATLRDSDNPLIFGTIASHEGFKVACAANLAVTVSARVKRDNLGLTLRLVCPGGQIAGVVADVVATAAAAVDTYETISITFTPTEAGVVDIQFQAYGGSTFKAYVDRFNALIQA